MKADRFIASTELYDELGKIIELPRQAKRLVVICEAGQPVKLELTQYAKSKNGKIKVREDKFYVKRRSKFMRACKSAVAKWRKLLCSIRK